MIENSSRGRARPRAPVSLVCVFNDHDVLEQCLARSFDQGHASAPRTELIAIDNSARSFGTAGAALNTGARSARNDVVAFVHQDVYLHSLEALEHAAAILLDSPTIGVLGSVGVDGHGRLIGRMRDRGVRVGEPAAQPRDVDSLDEVLFLVRRADVLRRPLAEDPELAWHAYAVEYAAQVRATGQRATALDIPITHNSMTTNLSRLDVAHRHVGDRYPGLRPLHTTCGTIGEPAGPRGLLHALRRRGHNAATWWQESLYARNVRVTDPDSAIVLGDLRFLLDRAAAAAGVDSIVMINRVDADVLVTAVDGIKRDGRPFTVADGGVEAMRRALDERPPTQALALTNLVPADLPSLGLAGHDAHVLGYSRAVGLWVFVGASPERLAPLWAARRNRPFAGHLQLGRGPAR